MTARSLPSVVAATFGGVMSYAFVRVGEWFVFNRATCDGIADTAGDVTIRTRLIAYRLPSGVPPTFDGERRAS